MLSSWWLQNKMEELYYDQSGYLFLFGSGYGIWSAFFSEVHLIDRLTAFKYLTHKKINVFLFFILKCLMCIIMRKIIFRLDITLLVHKSKEITSRREYYFFFAQVQEITIFPSMFMFWYLISLYFSPHVVVHPFMPLDISS